MSDIVARLREQVSSDHVKGCDGRCYACDCGYDDQTQGLLEMAADEIERLKAIIAYMGEMSLAPTVVRREARRVAEGKS